MRAHATPVSLAQRMLSALRGANHHGAKNADTETSAKEAVSARSSTASGSSTSGTGRPFKRRLSWERLLPLPSKLGKRSGSNASVASNSSTTTTTAPAQCGQNEGGGQCGEAVRVGAKKLIMIDGAGPRSRNPAIRRCLEDRPRPRSIDVCEHVPALRITSDFAPVPPSPTDAVVPSDQDSDSGFSSASVTARTGAGSGSRRRGVRFSSDPDIIISYEADSDLGSEHDGQQHHAKVRRPVTKPKNVHANFIKSVPQEHSDLTLVFDMIDTYTSHGRSASM